MAIAFHPVFIRFFSRRSPGFEAKRKIAPANRNLDSSAFPMGRGKKK
jgi:hypothetical protein